jgi:flagellin
MSDITLSAGIRQNLLSLQQTSTDLTTTQEALATGKAVNSAADNPSAFFTSQNLTNTANSLSALLDQIGQGQQTINAATNGLTGLTSLLQQALSTAQQAQQASTGTVTFGPAITGTQTIAADTTQAVGTTSIASALGAGATASTQSQSDFLAAGLTQLVAGNTLTYTLNGDTVVATFGAATNTATNTFSNAAGLISVLNTGTGTGGNLSAVALVASDGSGGVEVTSDDLTHNITTSAAQAAGASFALTGANFTSNTTSATLGSALTITDGEGHTSNFYDVATNASPANDTFTSLANLVSAINGSNLGATVTASASGTNLELNSPDGAITVGQTAGSFGATLGFSASYDNNFNATLSGLASGSTLTVQVGSNATHTITFGTGVGQVSTQAELQTALSGFTDITATVNNAGKIVLTPTSTDPITIGGTPATAASLGLGLGLTTPTATVVTPNATRTTLQTNYNGLLTQINQLASDASYNGVNLLGGDNLTVNFNPDGTSSLTIAGVVFNAQGLGLAALNGNQFQDNNSIGTVVTALNNAISSVQTQTETFGTNSGVIGTRQTFETNMINTLQTGASNLVVADQNQESADLLTEQTQQQLEISALSIANQANQSVLKLFG